MENRQNSSLKNIRVFLSLPRCGTHFMWTRCVHSGCYQLIYDADIIAALTVLSDECDEPLGFLCRPVSNPYYNFGYNSMSNAKGSLTAAEHLEALSEKYSAPCGFELFKKIMSLQDNGSKNLLLINRFIYTTSYRLLFKNFEWKTEHAERSLRLLHKWMSLAGYNTKFTMVIRKVAPWVKSQIQMQGKAHKCRIIKLLKEAPVILKTCQDLNIPVFLMEDIIRIINGGNLSFENHLLPLSEEEIHLMWENPLQYEKLFDSVISDSPKLLRIDRLKQYINEKDPIKRISLVRSIGSFPIKISQYIPIFGRIIQEDYKGTVLNNAKIQI